MNRNLIGKTLLLLILLVPFCIYGQNPNNSADAVGEGFEIVFNKVNDGGRSGLKDRHIFILIEEKEFNFDNLNEIFSKYKALYPEPFSLRISVYASREMLQRLINFEKQPMTIEFSEDEKGREAARKFYERYYPLAKGYSRADYSRYGEFEFFDYSLRKESERMIRVTLKTQVKRLITMKPEEGIFEAIDTGDAEAAKAFLEKGVNPNLKVVDETPLIVLASFLGHNEIIKLLAKAKADLNGRNVNELGAIDEAVFYGRLNTVKLLIEIGTDVNSSTSFGVTPLMGAVQFKNNEIVTLLLKAGAKVNASTPFGITPLMLALDNTDIVNNLLASGAKIDAQDVDGNTAVFYAIMKGYPNKLEYLISKGARIKIKNKEGLSALQYAEKQELEPETKTKILEILKKAEKSLN